MAKGGLFGTGFEHPDDAAAEALYALTHQPRAANQEYMGLLVKGPDGKIYRTDFQTEGSKTTSSWTGVPGGRVMGTVHNHPKRTRPDQHFGLSSVDMQGAKQLAKEMGLPVHAFVTTIGESHDDRVYRPENSKTAVTPWGTPGEQFLAQFPIDEQRKRIILRIQNNQKLSPDIKARLLQNMIRGAQVTQVPPR